MKTLLKFSLFLALNMCFVLTSHATLFTDNNPELFEIYEAHSIKADSTDTLNSKKQVVLFNAEQMPKFKGGNEALFTYIRNNVDYPASVRENAIEDKVYVKFTVNIDGSLTDITAMAGKNNILRDAAIKAVKEMPNWEPAINKGEPVAVKLVLPILFVLK